MKKRTTSKPPSEAVNLIHDEVSILREIRKKRNITQAALAKRMKIGQEGVSRIERRGYDMKLSTLRDYCRGLGGQLKLIVTFPE